MIEENAGIARTDVAATTDSSDFLAFRDLAMMSTAIKYDLTDKSEKTRSVRDLSRLFFQVSDILDVDLFVEAGAKDAASSRRARRRINPKRIVAFEANPYVYDHYAKANNGDVGVEYEHLALSQEPGSVTFNVMCSEDGTPKANGQASLLKRQEQADTGFVEVTVDATTLDRYFEDHDFSRAALWVDVEGAAHAVLSGGTDTLRRTATVMIEVEDRAYWGEQQWLRQDIVSFLYRHGLVPVARDFQSRYQYNIVFVRSDLLNVDRVRWALTLLSSAGYSSPADGKE